MKRTLEQIDDDHRRDGILRWEHMRRRRDDLASEIANEFTGKVDGWMMPYLYEAAAKGFALGFRDGVLSEEAAGVCAESDGELDDLEWLFGAAE